MSKEIKGNGKHLTLDDRSALQAGLDQKKSFRAIAKELHKDPSTLAKEVKLNRTAYGRCFYTNSFGNLCKYARLCKKTNLCHNRAKCKASLCCRCRIHDFYFSESRRFCQHQYIYVPLYYLRYFRQNISPFVSAGGHCTLAF